MAHIAAMTIRPVVAEDLPVLVALEREVYPEPWSEGIFRDELGQENRVYLAAEDDTGICGYGGLMLVDEDAHITTVAVAARARQQGVGTRLMLALIEAGLEAKARNLTLEVRMTNQAARDLYQRFGFAPVGLRKNYYRTEDALVMWVIDIDQPDYAMRLEDIRKGLR